MCVCVCVSVCVCVMCMCACISCSSLTTFIIVDNDDIGHCVSRFDDSYWTAECFNFDSEGLVAFWNGVVNYCDVQAGSSGIGRESKWS